MRKLLLSACLLVSLQAATQNVGVGTHAPTERLDVNGNLNVSGHIKLNGQAGRSGQVLMVGNDGVQAWGNAFGYRNGKVYDLPGGSFTFTVPANVREVMVTALAGGGGGAKSGGGGGGGLIVAIYKVAPGQVINVYVGFGGSGASAEAGAGSDGFGSSITFGTNAVYTYGGKGATANGPGEAGYWPTAAGDSLQYVEVYPGLPGTSTTETYSQRTSTDYVTCRYYGNGSTNTSTPGLMSKGGFFSFNTVTLLNLFLSKSPNGAEFPGAGGAAGNTTGGFWGQYGGSGYVGIYW